MLVVEGLVRGIAASSLGLSESPGKTSHTVSHSFSNSFSIRLSFWTIWKEKGGGGGEAASSARVLFVLNEEEIWEEIEGHIASKCKEDEFEGIDVTNFGCLLGMDLLGKKARPSRDSVLEFWSSDASCSERDRFFAYLPSGRLC